MSYVRRGQGSRIKEQSSSSPGCLCCCTTISSGTRDRLVNYARPPRSNEYTARIAPTAHLCRQRADSWCKPILANGADTRSSHACGQLPQKGILRNPHRGTWLFTSTGVGVTCKRSTRTTLDCPAIRGKVDLYPWSRRRALGYISMTVPLEHDNHTCTCWNMTTFYRKSISFLKNIFTIYYILPSASGVMAHKHTCLNIHVRVCSNMKNFRSVLLSNSIPAVDLLHNTALQRTTPQCMLTLYFQRHWRTQWYSTLNCSACSPHVFIAKREVVHTTLARCASTEAAQDDVRDPL